MESQSPIAKNSNAPDVRSYSAGDIIFAEGSKGTEFYVIQSGLVGIYKNSKETKVELARIEKGGIVGELALFDNLPRSVTAMVLEPTTMLVVSIETFKAAMQSVPLWVTSLIKIVVNRLRNVNNMVYQAVPQDKPRSITSLMLLLLPHYKKEVESRPALHYAVVLTEAFYLCHFKKKEIDETLGGLAKRGMIEMTEGAENEMEKNIIIQDLEVLRLFEEYCALRQEGKTFKENAVSEDALAIISNIAYVAQKSGEESADGTRLLKTALVEDLAEKENERLERCLLELRRLNLISVMPSDGDGIIIFSKEKLSRIKKIRQWLPKFEADML